MPNLDTIYYYSQASSSDSESVDILFPAYQLIIY